jgi:AcrR family transcriptional regulator
MSKKDQIVSTGEDLFYRHGLRRVTVEEICREANVSKMTFYKHFENKLDLFKHIWTLWSDSLFERLEIMEKKGASFMEKMKAIVDFKMELLEKMNPALLDDVIHSDPELVKFIQGLRAKSMERFFEIVSTAREKGDMRDIRTEFMLVALDHLGKMAENDELRRLYPSDMEFFRELNDFFFFGIMPAPCGGED